MQELSHRIDRQAEFAIAQSPHTRLGKIAVCTQAGCLTLTGEVDSFFAKQMAQEALRGIAGVHQINNQLEVNWKEASAVISG